MDTTNQSAQLRVRFISAINDADLVVSDAPFAIPGNTTRKGLSEIVNHLLERDPPIKFDFLIKDELLRVRLDRFVTSHRISTEEIVPITYFIATSLSDETQQNELPSWVSDIASVDSNNSLALSSGYDGSVRLFDTNTLEIKHEFIAHTDPIKSICAWNSNSNSYVATASKDLTVKIWSRKGQSFQHLANLVGHVNSVECVQVGNSVEDTLLSGDWSGSLMCWKMSDINSQPAAEDEKANAKKRKTTKDKSVSVASIAEVKPFYQIKAHTQLISSINPLSSANDIIFTTSWDFSIKQWDLVKQDCISTINCGRVITSADLNTDLQLGTAHSDGSIRIWDRREKESTTGASLTIDSDENWLSQIRWNPNSTNHFAVANYAGEVQLWDIRSPSKALSSKEAHEGKALCLHWFNNDNNNEVSIISGGSDCRLNRVTLN